MPIHDVGYRSWAGRLTSTWTRWWIIAEAGVIGALKSRWVRRALLASWLPVLYLGTAFFAFEQMLDQGEADFSDIGKSFVEGDMTIQELGEEVGEQAVREASGRAFEERFEMFPDTETLVAAFEGGDERQIRHQVWSWMLSMFLRYPQGIMTLLIVGLIVPPLISRDVRSRAFLLYYSRPITRMEYLVGKMAVPVSILLMITMLPALGLYFFGLMLSPDLSVVLDTWDLPFRVVLAALVCIIPVCLISLLFSSMTQESRFAGFAWFTVWSLGAVVWSMIYFLNQLREMEEFEEGAMLPEFDSNWSLVSLYSTIGRVQSWLFGLETDMTQVLPSMIMLAVVCAVSFVWLYRRVSAPVRI